MTDTQQSAKQNDTCGGCDGCGCADQQTLMRSQAHAQINLGHFWYDRDRPDLSAMFADTATRLLEEGDGFETEVGFWLLTLRTGIAQKNGDNANARGCAAQAYALAGKIFEPVSYNSVIAAGNYAEILAEVGEKAEAKKLLESVFSTLQALFDQLDTEAVDAPKGKNSEAADAQARAQRQRTRLTHAREAFSAIAKQLEISIPGA